MKKLLITILAITVLLLVGVYFQQEELEPTGGTQVEEPAQPSVEPQIVEEPEKEPEPSQRRRIRH